MNRNWEGLGKALAAARREAGIRQSDLAARLDVGLSSVQAIERGTKYAKPTPTIRAYAHAVGWTRDSVDAVLAGSEPTLHTEGGAEPSAPVPTGQLPVRIAADLADPGAVIDTDVIRLPGGTQAVVVVKGKANATPEEIQAGLEAWRRMQPTLHAPPGVDEPPASTEA